MALPARFLRHRSTSRRFNNAARSARSGRRQSAEAGARGACRSPRYPMTLRGLVGALVGFVAALVLILCLTQTRDWLGRSQWGIWWYYRWGQNPHFDSFQWPLAYLAPVGV